MKFYITAEDRHISIDQAFTLNDIQYPAGYLRGLTPTEREVMGLQEVVEVGVRESQETHFVTEELVGAELRITSIPKPESSKAEKLKKAADECKADMDVLQIQYLSALFNEDAEGIVDIKAEAASRKANYKADLKKIREA